MNKKILNSVLTSLSIIFILILAFLLRSYFFLHHDFYFLVDQARDLLLVKDIVVDHHITLIGARAGLGGVFHGPLWLYMLIPTFLFSHGDPFWTLVPVFLFIGLLTVVLAFIIGSKLYSKQVGLLMALALAVTPTLATSAMSITNAYVMPLIFLLFLCAAIIFIRGKDKALVFCLLFIGLGIHFESAFAVFLLPLTVIAFLLRRKSVEKKYLFYSLVTFLVSVSNFFVFELRHRFIMSQSLQQLFAGKVEPLKGYEQYADIGFRISVRMNELRESYVLFLMQNNTLSKLFIYGVLLAVAVIVSTNLIKKKKVPQFDKEYIFIFLIPLLYYVIYIFYPMPLWPHYILPITISSALLLAISVDRLPKNIWRSVVITALVSMLVVPAVSSLKNTYGIVYQPQNDGSYLSQLTAANYIYTDAGKKEFGYFVYHPATFSYNMDYLLWWLGKTKYNITPSNQKHALTYLILYTAPVGDKGAYDFWKKNVVRTTGRVVSTKTVQGGVTIEKLMLDPKEQSADPNYYQNLLFR